MKVIKRLNKFMKRNTLLSLILLMIILFFIFFWLSYIFVFVPSPFGVISSSHSTDWLQWIGAFMGGVLGGLFAFIGVRITLEDQREAIQYENKRKALPLIDIDTGEYDYRNRGIAFDFCFTEESRKRKSKDIPDTAHITISLENVGLRELYDLHIGDINSSFFETSLNENYYHITPIVYGNKPVFLNLSFREKGSYDKDNMENLYGTHISHIGFRCYFSDCYDNWYYQEFNINLFHSIKPNMDINERALNIDFQGYDIMSSPIEISQYDLPWENGESVVN